MYFLPFKKHVMKISLKFVHVLGVLLLFLVTGCSHKFDSNVLDLAFYQWNLWPDEEAGPEDQLPSCGWEDLHRGMGKLVRIPALARDHFPGDSLAKVYWYHCRFTLPEAWKEKEVTLRFEGVGPVAEVYLNEDPIGTYTGTDGDFDIDVSGIIYHTRDNHLAIRVIVPDEADGYEPGGAKAVGDVSGSEGQGDRAGGSPTWGTKGAGIAGTVSARVRTTP